MAIDPLSAVVLKGAGTYVLKRVGAGVASAINRNTDNLLEAYRIDAENWRLQRLLHLDRQYERLEREVDGVAAKVAEMFEDRQFVRLWDGIEFQAALEALDERREMLAGLAAGIIDPRLSLEERVDVDRVVRTLSVDDVRTLYGLRRVRGKTDVDGKQFAGTAELVTAVLLRTGRQGKLSQCLDDRVGAEGWGGGGASRTYYISKLGRDVLRVLHCYLVQKGAPFVVPGREELPAIHITEAWAVVERFDGLRSFLDWAKAERERQGRIGMQYVRQPNTPPTLNVNVFSADRRAMIMASDGAERDDVSVEVSPTNEHGYFVVFARGPDRILRVIADHIDADLDP